MEFLNVVYFLIRNTQMVFIFMLGLLKRLSVPNSVCSVLIFFYSLSFSSVIFCLLTSLHNDWPSPFFLQTWSTMPDFGMEMIVYFSAKCVGENFYACVSFCFKEKSVFTIRCPLSQLSIYKLIYIKNIFNYMSQYEQSGNQVICPLI